MDPCQAAKLEVGVGKPAIEAVFAILQTDGALTMRDGLTPFAAFFRIQCGDELAQRVAFLQIFQSLQIGRGIGVGAVASIVRGQVD